MSFTVLEFGILVNDVFFPLCSFLCPECKETSPACQFSVHLTSKGIGIANADCMSRLTCLIEVVKLSDASVLALKISLSAVPLLFFYSTVCH